MDAAAFDVEGTRIGDAVVRSTGHEEDSIRMQLHVAIQNF
jgi:hypothetical protein